MSENQFAMVSNWMENGNIIDFVGGRSDVNRIKLVCWFEVSPPRFVDTDKFVQLAGVANGLLYIHGKGMIHGDLKGVCLLFKPLLCHQSYFLSRLTY